MADFSVALQPLSFMIGEFSWSNTFNWLVSGLGLAIYVMLIWNFYRFVARRDIFQHKLTVTYPGIVGFIENVVNLFLQFVKFGVIFPLISFLWFGGYSILLFVVAKNQSIDQVVLISIAVISGARILSYYNQEAAQELAKILPMVILGVAIVDPSFFQFSEFYSRILEIPKLSQTLLQFVIYLSVLELFLRILLTAKEAAFGKQILPPPSVTQVRLGKAKQ